VSVLEWSRSGPWPSRPRQLAKQPSPQADASIDVPVASVGFCVVRDGKCYLPVVLCVSQPPSLHIGNQVLIHRGVNGLHPSFPGALEVGRTSRFWATLIYPRRRRKLSSSIATQIEWINRSYFHYRTSHARKGRITKLTFRGTLFRQSFLGRHDTRPLETDRSRSSQAQTVRSFSAWRHSPAVDESELD